MTIYLEIVVCIYVCMNVSCVCVYIYVSKVVYVSLVCAFQDNNEPKGTAQFWDPEYPNHSSKKHLAIKIIFTLYFYIFTLHVPIGKQVWSTKEQSKIGLYFPSALVKNIGI